MADESQQVERARAALEAAEQALAEALDARANAVKTFAALKAGSPDVYFALPGEHQVIARMTERVQVFPRTAVGAVMTEVLSACARMVAPVEIVYVGQEGGFGHVAARKQYGSSAVLRSVDTAEEALSEVERGRASFAIMPFETSNDGAVTATLNLLARSDAKVCAEIKIRRAFHLISQSGDRTLVKKIYASASATAACESHLNERFPDALIIDCRGRPERRRADDRSRRRAGRIRIHRAIDRGPLRSRDALRRRRQRLSVAHRSRSHSGRTGAARRAWRVDRLPASVR
jgi:chorismate mutase/prephenate dehydratase